LYTIKFCAHRYLELQIGRNTGDFLREDWSYEYSVGSCGSIWQQGNLSEILPEQSKAIQTQSEMIVFDNMDADVSRRSAL